jgi:hypothetical protein
MRACFLGQNICVLGFGVASLQVPPLVMDEPADEPLAGSTTCEHVTQKDGIPTALPLPLSSTAALCNKFATPLP